MTEQEDSLHTQETQGKRSSEQAPRVCLGWGTKGGTVPLCEHFAIARGKKPGNAL